METNSKRRTPKPKNETSEIEPTAVATESAATAPEAESVKSAQPLSGLDRLMMKSLSGRRRMLEAQAKLREMESEMRASDPEKRSRFERLRQGALDEYRKARAEAAQARQHLVASLRMLPQRS